MTREHETRIYWEIARDLAEADGSGDDPAEYLDELDAMRMHSENPLIRHRCLVLLTAHRMDVVRQHRNGHGR